MLVLTVIRVARKVRHDSIIVISCSESRKLLEALGDILSDSNTWNLEIFKRIEFLLYKK